MRKNVVTGDVMEASTDGRLAQVGKIISRALRCLENVLRSALDIEFSFRSPRGHIVIVKVKRR